MPESVVPHVVVPFAAVLWPEDRPAGAPSAAELPRLAELLARADLRAAPGEDAAPGGDAAALTFTPPHERVLAQLRGVTSPDGLLPWAGADALSRGLPVEAGGPGWAWLLPTHWALGTEQVSLHHPAHLGIDAPTAEALFEAARPLLDGEGWRLERRDALRWLLAHPDLAGLPTASFDRVVGRNIDRWLDPHPAARTVRRLQSEVQMAWHTLALNTAREARGLKPINSFWLCGTGDPAQAAALAAPVQGLQLADTLRAPALAADGEGWRSAWRELDQQALAPLAEAAGRDQPWRLTLCGERTALTLEPKPRGGWLQRLRRPAPVEPATVLARL